MTEEEKRPGFWHTLPGILTGVAAIITALTGFIVVIHQAGVFGVADKEPSQIQIEVVRRPKQLTGNYYVRGRNPDGTSYHGEAIIKHEGDHYEIVWKIADKQTYYGSGTLVDNLLQIKWEHGLVTYIMREDGTLHGSWADGRGTETLKPYSND